MNAVSVPDPFAADALAAELAASEPVYTRSNGQAVPLSSMATPHLRSAHAKLTREWPGHPEIGPMAGEIAKRDAAYQAEQLKASEGAI